MGPGSPGRHRGGAHPTSPCIGFTAPLSGNTLSASTLLRQPELVLQHALHHRAQIGGRREVAALIEIGGLQPRPVRDHAAAFHRAAGEQRDGAGAVIGALRAVDARGAAEFGGDHDHGVAPARAQARFRIPPARRRGRRAVAPAGPTGPPSLAWVSQPSKASAPIRGPSSAAISFAAPRATSRIAADAVGAGLWLHVVALRGLVEREALLQRAASAGSRC